MKYLLVTAALAATLSAGTVAASAMPVTALSSNAAASASVELVGHRGHKYGEPRHYGHKFQKQRRHYILPRRVVVRSLHHRGFRNIRNVRLRHGDYVVHARGYRGPVRLVVDGRTARILSRQPLHRGWHRPGFSFHGHNDSFSYFLGIR
jgi:hypothetical protein